MLWEFLRDAYDDFSRLVLYNLLWALTTVLVVTAPAGAAGLYYAVNQMAHFEPADWRTFFEGFRRYWGLGLRWSLVNLVAVAVIVFSYWFYGQFPAGWAPLVKGFVLGVGILWLLLQVYTFPLLLEQEDRRMRVALRNSAVLYLKRPGLALGLSLLLVVLVGLSFLFWVPWFLFTASLAAYLAARVTVFLIGEMQASEKPASPVE